MNPWFIQRAAAVHQADLQRRTQPAGLDEQRRRRRNGRPAPRRAVGIALIRLGGRLAAGESPAGAPCPWCDLAFPPVGHAPKLPVAPSQGSTPPLAGHAVDLTLHSA